MRLAIVTNILAPYRIPLFEELARRCDDFLVILLADRHANRDWSPTDVGFKTHTLRGLKLRTASVDPMHLNLGSWSALRRFRPDLVIGGGFAPAQLEALLYCRAHRKPYVSWGELFLRHESESSWIRRCLRHAAVRASQGWIASSSDSRDAFVHYGADAARVKVSLMPVRNALFRGLAAESRESGAVATLRGRYGTPLICAVGRLVPQKGWRELLRAFATLRPGFPGASLVIAGEGPDKPELEARARAAGADAVHFIGNRDTRELATLYAAADWFVFPSLCDPFGAVLAEAQACGTPAVSSIHAGATRDLVADGSTGFIMDPLQPGSLENALHRALSLPPTDRSAMAARAEAQLPADDAVSGAADIISYASDLVTRRGAWSSGRAVPD